MTKRALAKKLNWIPSLFAPFVSNRMIEQHAHDITNFLMQELDTISDFLSCERAQVSRRTDLILLDNDLWGKFKKDPEFQAKKKLDKISYVWDEIIEEMHQTYLESNLITMSPIQAITLPI